MKRTARYFSFLAMMALTPHEGAHACACGCNMFAVGNRWFMPVTSGFGGYLKYDYANQTRNWAGWQRASTDLNEDQIIRSSYLTVGLQTMIDRTWGGVIEVPVVDRTVMSIDEGGEPVSISQTSIGDMRLMVRYTGFAEDMSTGVLLGAKLPTGPFSHPELERDTQIGTGTTDLLFGAYTMHGGEEWGWYGHVMWQHAFNERDGYRPGDSFDAALGIHYDGWVSAIPIIPALQVAGSIKGHDSGESSAPDETGYERLYLVPGLQIVATGSVNLFVDFRIPLMTHVHGVQLVAPALFSATASITL